MALIVMSPGNDPLTHNLHFGSMGMLSQMLLVMFYLVIVQKSIMRCFVVMGICCV